MLVGINQSCNTCSLSQNPESEIAQKQAEQERLRKAEKFMKIGTGQAECVACGYSYDPKKGDSEYPVSPGTKFEVGSKSVAGVIHIFHATRHIMFFHLHQDVSALHLHAVSICTVSPWAVV